MEFLKAIKSVLSAMIGVQKKQNLKEDFAKKSAMPFIVAGLLMAFVFVVLIWVVVQLVLKLN